MKLLLIVLTLAGSVLAQGQPPTIQSLPAENLWRPDTLTLSAGKGRISINLKTGAVELPKDMTLPDAAVAFWLRVAQAFPECRRAMLTGDPTPMTTEWVEFGQGVRLFANGRSVSLGLRSDGVVVWRKGK